MAKRRSAHSRHPYGLKLKKSTAYAVSASLCFLSALFIWLSFTRQGVLLTRINFYLVENFGLIPAFFLPFPFIAGGLMVVKSKTSLARSHVFLGSLITILTLGGLFHDGFYTRQIFENLVLLLSRPGTYLILLGGLFIGLMVMSNLPFTAVLSFLGQIFSWIISHLHKSPDALSGKSLKVTANAAPVSASPPVMVRAPSAPPAPLAPKPPSKPISGFTPPLIPHPTGATDKVWHYPPHSILADNISGKADRGDVKANADTIEKTLDAFGIIAKVAEINRGPAVTQYALEVAIGTKLSKISALSNDLALALAAPTGQIRIEAPIPGRSLVGIELPNRSPEFVSLRKVLDSDAMSHHKSKLAVSLGLDVSGSPMVADIAKMPHVLIAGATGTGKSVFINSVIASLLFRTSPQEVNLILVDPKRVELTNYNGIPHLLTPVIVEPEKVLSALKWAMSEMDRRYKQFAEVGVRNLEAFNELSGFQSQPYIVIIIDELADIMLFAPVEVEDAITRLAQMARATGIHLVLATQRPSVDIITGLIKANIPTRVAFAVSSMIDSRVILDQPGAEKLLGKGDMLFVPPDQAKPLRIQGSFISDKEINQLISFLKQQGVAPQYTDEVTSMPVSTSRRGKGLSGSDSSLDGERDPLFEEAFRLIIQNNTASASFLQRKLSLGYTRAARILDEMERAGIIGPVDGAKPREILVRELPSSSS